MWSVCHGVLPFSMDSSTCVKISNDDDAKCQSIDFLTLVSDYHFIAFGVKCKLLISLKLRHTPDFTWLSLFTIIASQNERRPSTKLSTAMFPTLFKMSSRIEPLTFMCLTTSKQSTRSHMLKRTRSTRMTHSLVFWPIKKYSYHRQHYECMYNKEYKLYPKTICIYMIVVVNPSQCTSVLTRRESCVRIITHTH